jgi:hypothetical protein
MRRCDLQLPDVLHRKDAVRRTAESSVTRWGLVVASVLTGCLSFSCARNVSVYVNGPKSLEGAEIRLDGRAAGRLEGFEADPTNTRGLDQKVSGAGGRVSVPLGAHELRIVKPGFQPIVRKVQYERKGEDYLSLDDSEVVATDTSVRP